MAKNKDINISPSKGISIIIKNDISQPPPKPKPKKKRRYKKIDVLPKTQYPQMIQSAGDTSYIKEQPGRFSLWRDTTTSTPVLTLAQATTQGFIPGLPPPPPIQPAPALPPQQLALPAPPITQYFGSFDRGLQPQEYKPDTRFQEPNMAIENGFDLNDTFYQALPEDKKEEYQNNKIEDIIKNIDETAANKVADIEQTDFYKSKLDPTTQAETIEKTKYLIINDKLAKMKEQYIKGTATKDIKSLSEARYPQNKIYRKFYEEGIKRQEEIIKKRIIELDAIIAKPPTQAEKKRSDAEKKLKNDELKKLEDLYNKMESEKKRIKKLLK